MQTLYWDDQYNLTANEVPFGARVHQKVFANLHDHLSSWKVDLDINGTANSFHKTVWTHADASLAALPKGCKLGHCSVVISWLAWTFMKFASHVMIKYATSLWQTALNLLLQTPTCFGIDLAKPCQCRLLEQPHIQTSWDLVPFHHGQNQSGRSSTLMTMSLRRNRDGS